MRINPGFWLPLLLLAGASHCRVLFWSDRYQWLPASWIDESRLLEARLDYEAKLNWYPLNQNELSRGIQTRVYLHEIQGERVVASRELARYAGWTLAGSLRAAGDHFFAIRGAATEMGRGPQELVIFPCCSGAAALTEPAAVIAAEQQMIAASPSPDGARLAVIETAASAEGPPGGDLVVRFFRLRAGVFHAEGRGQIYFAGAPGLPEFVWAPDASGLYVRDTQSSVKFITTDGVRSAAAQFPACFRQPGDASPRGALWLRSYDPERETPAENLAEGVVVHASGAGAVVGAANAMISDPARIGEGCP